MAKDCSNAVKCIEFDGTQHNTAMHPGPAHDIQAATTHDGGEGEEHSNI